MPVSRLYTALALLACSSSFGQQTYTNWPEYLGGPDSSHYSPLKQINRSNVDKLEVAWTYETGDDLSYTFSPLVIDNVAYFAAKGGSLVAVDASTGKELWVHPFPQAPGTPAAFARFSGITGQRGGNYWESKDRRDRRLFVSASGFLHAIDAKTGKLVDSFADHGKLDLKIGLDRAPRRIIIAERRPCLREYPDTRKRHGRRLSGAARRHTCLRHSNWQVLWVFHTIPRPGEFGYDTWPKDAYKYMGGVDTWGEITVDEKRGIVYLPVASPKYELYGGDRHGNNLFADCLLALDAPDRKVSVALSDHSP